MKMKPIARSLTSLLMAFFLATPVASAAEAIDTLSYVLGDVMTLSISLSISHETPDSVWSRSQQEEIIQGFKERVSLFDCMPDSGAVYSYSMGSTDGGALAMKLQQVPVFADSFMWGVRSVALDEFVPSDTIGAWDYINANRNLKLANDSTKRKAGFLFGITFCFNEDYLNNTYDLYFGGPEMKFSPKYYAQGVYEMLCAAMLTQESTPQEIGMALAVGYNNYVMEHVPVSVESFIAGMKAAFGWEPQMMSNDELMKELYRRLVPGETIFVDEESDPELYQQMQELDETERRLLNRQ